MDANDVRAAAERLLDEVKQHKELGGWPGHEYPSLVDDIEAVARYVLARPEGWRAISRESIEVLVSDMFTNGLAGRRATRLVLVDDGRGYPTADWRLWDLGSLSPDAITHRLCELIAHGGWRDITTAPKDGPLWLYGPTLVDADFNPNGSVEGYWQDGDGWIGAVWNNCQDCWESKQIMPTHWQPLPSPPARKDAADE